MSIAGLFTNKGLQQIGYVYWGLLSLSETHPFLVCLTQTQKHQNRMCLPMLLGMLHAKKIHQEMFMFIGLCPLLVKPTLA